jgi:hypothetical protein
MRRGVLVLTLLVVAGEVRAQPKQNAPQGQGQSGSEAYGRGEAQYQAGAYLEAAASFEAAYAAERDPSILFNIAQAYRFGKSCAKSADYYRRFLGAVSDAPNAKQIRAYIAEQERCAGRTVDDARLMRREPAEVTPRAGGGGARRAAGLAIIGAGVVAIAAGGYFSWRVGDLEREREGCTPCRLEELDALDRRGRRAEIAQVVAYGVGGLAVAGGVWLYVSGRGAGEAPSIAIVPVAQGGVVVGTRRF